MTFRSSVFVIFLVAACTKANPAHDCDNGACADPAYPYCDRDGLFSDEPNTCVAVRCVPGAFSGCSGDDALVCNEAGDNYDRESCEFGCAAEVGGCKACSANTACPSGVCRTDGRCAERDEITHVSPTGSDISDCSETSPCTLTRALLLPTSGVQYILVASGTYTSAETHLVGGTRVVVGSDPRPKFRRSTDGAIITLDGNSNLTLEHVDLSAATGGSPQQAVAVDCPEGGFGPKTLVIDDSVLSMNGSGLHANTCTITLRNTKFTDSPYGVEIYNSSVSIDRCEFSGGQLGAQIHGSELRLTNSFATHNAQFGFFINAATTAAAPPTNFEFNTAVDNGTGIGCQGFNVAVANSLIARNTTNTNGTSGPTNCTFPGSIIRADVNGLNFVSPDQQPYNYHLMSGSIAIDAATQASVDHDVDNDARPRGMGRDVGADEY